MISKNLLIAAKVLLLGMAGFTVQAQAATVSRLFDGNDCVGYFTVGNGFDSCTIFVNTANEQIELSPVIAKFDGDLLIDDLNETVFPSVDGNEFSFSNPSVENKIGTWTYEADADDPGVRYWASKAGDNFLLFWDVDDAALEDNAVCDVSDVYILGCLEAANVMVSGNWSTPNDQKLSHITFYDTAAPDIGGGPPVPIPAAAWLFGSAIFGLVGIGRVRRNTAPPA